MSSPSRSRPGILPRAGVLRQAGAVFRKELMAESRSLHGLATSGLFTLVIAATLGYSSILEKPSPTLAAAMVTAGLLFSSALTVPRTYLAEDEQGTMDFLRLRCDPASAFLGKLLYALLVNLVAGAAFTAALAAFLGAQVAQPALFAAASAGAVVAAASSMAFVSSLVLGAANKWILAAALGVPLLLPQSILAVLALRHALGGGGARDAATSAVGLWGFALASAALGVVLSPWLWGLSGREARDGDPVGTLPPPSDERE